jgi:hypothetical protein
MDCSRAIITLTALAVGLPLDLTGSGWDVLGAGWETERERERDGGNMREGVRRRSRETSTVRRARMSGMYL